MNNIRNIEKLNQSELELGIPYSASWHQDFSHTAYIFFAGLSYDLTEGDILIIFSQYGIPVHMKLVRDKETGKSKGFGWLKYEDQRSTILAVDNLNGAKVLGRVMKVDHAVYEERERDDEYEALLEEELKNDFADLEELKKEKNAKKNEDERDDDGDEFKDPLLLMSKTKDEDHHRRSHRSRHEHSGRRRHHEEDRERRSHRSHSEKERDRELERRSEKGHSGDRDRDSSRSFRDREGDRRSETRSHRERDEKYRESRSRRDENDDERRDKDSRSERRTIGRLEQPTHERHNETSKYSRRYREPEPEPESSTVSNIQSAADVGKDSNRLAKEREEDLEL